MTEHIVREWLSDYAALSPEEVHSFATSLEHNQELVSALYSVLENREYYQKVKYYIFLFPFLIALTQNSLF